MGLLSVLSWQLFYALHTVVTPSHCGMFVYEVVTSIAPWMVFSGTFILYSLFEDTSFVVLL